LIFGWEIPVGSRIFGKIAPLDWIFIFFNFASYSACWTASIEFLFVWIGCVVKSFAMEYFGWETPFGRIFYH
jgi:hypothetical protein